MLQAFLIIAQVVVTFANPFHKYPYVFLLDVGNEELEKTNTEQFRVSMPGGSLAIRYPAIGDGDIIAHIRVSGIDFGTDLKANIVDGGPGSKYVVLAFIGNPGIAYEAVVSVQTIPNSKSVYYDYNDEDGYVISQGKYDPYALEQDNNDSAEDTNDSESQYIEKMNTELTQSSSNVYNYAVNDVNNLNNRKETAGDQNGYEVEEEDYDSEAEDKADEDFENEVNNKGSDNSEPVEDEKDIHRPVPEQTAYDKVEVEDYVEDTQSGDQQAEDLDEKNAYSNSEEPVKVDKNLYKMYEALRPHLYDAKVMPIETYNEQSNTAYQEDPVEIDQMFNDEEVHNDGKYWDSNNNNNFDSDDTSAVAY